VTCADYHGFVDGFNRELLVTLVPSLLDASERHISPVIKTFYENPGRCEPEELAE